MAFDIRTFVPVAQASIRAFVVPDNIQIDVLTDQFPGVGPGDYVQVDDAGTAVRAWARAEFEAAYTPAP